MNRTPLGLEHAPLLNEKFKSLKWGISEYSFANLYLFREVHKYEVLREGEDVFILGVTRDGFRYLMPTAPFEENLGAFLSKDLSLDFLFPIPAEAAHYFPSNKYRIDTLEADSDYIFCVKTMATYPGGHLSKKRNLVTQFESNYEAKSLLLTESCKEDAVAVLNLWKGQQDPASEDDFSSCLEALEKISLLGLTGRLYYIEMPQKVPVGFLLGEGLTSDTFVLHFAKADKNYKGLYQYIYQNFAQSLSQEYAFLNLEPDLGHPTLRQSKHSYSPHKLEEKLRISLI